MLGLPNPWLLLAGVAAVALMTAGAAYEGYHYRGLEDAAALAAAEKAVVVQTTTADAITAATVATSTAQIQAIDQFTRTQIIEVPHYVTIKADAACIVPRGFVRVHDDAATGVPSVPDSAGQSDDAQSGVALSAVADTVVDNYGRCRATAQQLKDLQAWILSQQASTNRFEAAR